MTTAKSSARLAEFHTLSGHPGSPADCSKCAIEDRRQRSAAASLRSHRRQISQAIDGLLPKAAAR
jgi:hypothetical protein